VVVGHKSNKTTFTWKKHRGKSKFHSNKIVLFIDLRDMKEAREWTGKIQAEAKQTEKTISTLDIQ
jgi:hypothetical protein